MVFENQSFNHSPHHQQQLHKQHCDRARSCYRLRQKKKERRLQHGPLSVRHHQQHVREIKRNNQEQKRENKLITAIVGSSIARNISVKNIENETNEVRLRFKSDSDCADALSWLESTDGQFFMRGVNQLIFILGTNDIHRVGAFQAVQRIDYTIEKIRRLYSDVNIIWQLLQQRTRKTWLLPEGQAVLNEIEKCNGFLLELAAKKKFDTIQPAIPIQYMYDGLHPSKYGVEMMEATIRNYLQQNKMVYSSSFSNVPRRFQSDTFPAPLMSINF
ncbi:unnamed protein product [Rotaria sp. Silwood1]|nr:unnamed protein product [Rotaria sp. Silwood1]CAF3848705.1 unnamed protein product [Rotaria sp. Silwood1]CAF3887564.1 unnamed protein product [Rotaria sp. Silwood1]CAF3940074.1 unnamed protein product [Rotaria sp. Silwood1]CAF4915787.1 unnamed protein product [Rotaria sp. Silwood1]